MYLFVQECQPQRKLVAWSSNMALVGAPADVIYTQIVFNRIHKVPLSESKVRVHYLG